MLVLTRKQGQKVVIGESTVLVVLQCKGGRVRLGIEAPPEVSVLRSELEPRTPLETARRLRLRSTTRRE